MKKPSNGWLKRSTNQMTAGCIASEITWTLDCVGTEWRGNALNCSLGPSHAHYNFEYCYSHDKRLKLI